MPQPLGYFDTSVILKGYLEEDTSPEAQRLLRRFRVVTSMISLVEAASGLYRRHAAQQLTEAHLRRVMAWLRKDREHWQLLEITIDLLSEAEAVIERTRARTLDAIHLSSALALRTVGGVSPPFITADERQRQAAQHLGLDVVWPG